MQNEEKTGAHHITISAFNRLWGRQMREEVYPTGFLLCTVDISYLTIAQQLLYSPLDGKVSDVRVVLSDADKQDRDICGMHDADQCSHHVTHCVTLRDDKPIEVPSRSE